MKAADVVMLGAVGALAWFLWQRRAGGGAGADAIDNVLRRIGVRTPNVIGEDALKPVQFPVINGEVYSQAIDAKTGRTVVRIFSTVDGVFKPLPESNYPSANRRAIAPKALPGFPALRKAGRPWYAPWDASGYGLKVLA